MGVKLERVKGRGTVLRKGERWKGQLLGGSEFGQHGLQRGGRARKIDVTEHDVLAGVTSC